MIFMKKNYKLANSVMKKILFSFTPFSFSLLLTHAAFTQATTTIEGVWRFAELIFPGKSSTDKDSTITNPQPSVMIFTKGYYSTVAEYEPRVAAAPAKDPKNLTDAEKSARYEEWRHFAASAGTYEIKGSTIIRHAIVAKNVGNMTRGTPSLQEFKLEGPNTLWLLPAASAPATEPRVKLTRLE
jgi:hypothetical protein